MVRTPASPISSSRPELTPAASTTSFRPSRTCSLQSSIDTKRCSNPVLLVPAWQGVADPIERVFALLSRYRQALIETECFYGCPIGSLALELHEPDPAVREKLAANFDGWVTAVQECL